MRPLRRFLALALFATILALGFRAFAAATPDPSDTQKFAQAIADAVRTKNWHMLIALALIGLVSTIKWIAPKIHGRVGAWLNSQRGGTVLVLVCGVLGAVGLGLYGGAKFNVNLLVSGVTLGVLASGGWNVVWDLIAPGNGKPPSENSTPTIPIQKVG